MATDGPSQPDSGYGQGPGLAVGTDLVEISRIEALLARHGDRFLARVYTVAEQEDAKGRAASLAARWAAKEATAKALGTGIGAVGWLEIEIVSDAAGRPLLCLHGRAQAVARSLGLERWAVSLTHEAGLALAFVVGASGVSLR